MKKWLYWVGGFLLVVLAALGVAAWQLTKEVEPYAKAKTAEYLKNKFGSDAEIGSLSVRVPLWSIVLGTDRQIRVTGSDIVVRQGGRRDIPPLLALKGFTFDVDASTVWGGEPKVHRLRLQGMEITMPPKGERPVIKGKGESAPPSEPPKSRVFIDEIFADGTTLTLWPKDPNKQPLRFELQKLKLEAAGVGVAMKYTTTMTNAKPPGLIQCTGTFGPWNTGTPSETPVTGKYRFDNANLGVFSGIEGILESEGEFAGPLNELTVDGWANVPNFRLKSVNQAVPLKTKFHAIVDGTNGNTLLQPVEATLGGTNFTCKGGVVRNKDEIGKTVALDVVMPRGNLDDLLRLAMKGDKPFLRGGVVLDLKFTLPPGKGPIERRLDIGGRFVITGGRFSYAEVQDRIDDFSRRTQGKPNDEDISKVPSKMAGTFLLRGGLFDLKAFRFNIPGAQVDLAGDYKFADEALDFHGTVRADAHLSEMMKTAWKRWALKAVDPFFAKEGAGTFLRIKIAGTRDNPQFGRE